MDIINVHDTHLFTLDVADLFNRKHWSGDCLNFLDDTIYFNISVETEKGPQEVRITGQTWAPREALSTQYERLLSRAQCALLVCACTLAPEDVKRDIKQKIEDVRRLAVQGAETPMAIFLMLCHLKDKRLVSLDDVQSVVQECGGKEISIYEMYGPDWSETALKIRADVLKNFEKQHAFDTFMTEAAVTKKQGRCLIS